MPEILKYEDYIKEYLPSDARIRETTVEGLNLRPGYPNAKAGAVIGLSDRYVNMSLSALAGKGKTNTLNQLLCAAATEYSPEEMSIWYVDGYDRNNSLLLGNRRITYYTSVELKMVLNKLYNLCRKRLGYFQHQQLMNYSEYRHTLGDNRMPRTLLVLDDCGDLLHDDSKTLDLLRTVMRLQRVCGIHILMITDTKDDVILKDLEGFIGCNLIMSNTELGKCEDANSGCAWQVPFVPEQFVKDLR